MYVDIQEALIFSQKAPLEQSYLTYIFGWLARQLLREGFEVKLPPTSNNLFVPCGIRIVSGGSRNGKV